MKKVIKTVFLDIAFCVQVMIFVSAFLAIGMMPVHANSAYEEPREMDFTCYIDRGTCYTGCQTRRGIAAADDAHIGMTAIVTTVDGEFVGIYEVLDKIGTEWGRQGNCIDIWCETLDEAKELMKLTGGKCIVQYVDAKG